MGRKGFSLVELMVVITIVGVLSAIGFASYLTYQTRAKLNKNVQILQNILDQAVEYANKYGRFPNRSQLNLPPNPNNGSYSQNSSIWGGNNGASWGDSCGKSGFYEMTIDPVALGLPNVIEFGLGCDIYHINHTIQKLCYYWEQTSGGYISGHITIPGFVNQYDGGSTAAFLALHNALLNNATCQ